MKQTYTLTFTQDEVQAMRLLFSGEFAETGSIAKKIRAAKADAPCVWTPTVDDLENIKFSTGCGSELFPSPETTDSDWILFCPFCGRPVRRKGGKKNV